MTWIAPVLERIWFRIRFAGEGVDGLYESPDYPDVAEFDLIDAARAECDFRIYLDELEESQRVTRGRSLDETFGDKTVTVDLRWLYAHMIGEYARHSGHADLIRELVDGVTGL
jgi:Protein of unknown function (DUF664)